MKLVKLELQDFQGLRHFVLEANGENCTVYGTNGSGKTTLANAITWLLSDKPYTGEKGWSPKTVGEDGKELHHLDHRAEAIFEKDDGSRITLAKDFHEVWKKKRGSVSEEFSGHVTDCYIDGVPVSTGEYKRTMEELCPPDQAKILTDPRYFARTMHWEDRRKILLEMCGDVTDAEVIQDHPELSDLWDFLRKPGTQNQYYTVQEFQKIAASRKAELNRELTILPARIDETLKSIPDVDGLDEETIKAKIQGLEDRKLDVMRRAASITEGEEIQALRRQKGELELKILDRKKDYERIQEEKNREANEAIRELGRAVAAADADYIAAENEAAMLEGQVKALESEREKLLQRFMEVKARVWDGETVCSACGQPLPEDRIQEARENFNLKKSREMSEINEQGQLCSASLIAQKSQELDRARAAMQAARERREKAREALEQAKTKTPEQPPFESTQEYADLSAEKADLEAQIKAGGAGADLRRREAQDELHILSEQIEQAQNDRALIVTARKRRERLAELEQDQKNTAAEYERFERGVYLCEEFTRAKVAMLDERINSRFKAVRFRLFKTQINGGLSDCCDVMCPTTSGLTPYESANNAAQINAGIEIAGALGAFWGQSMPMIVDNAESVVQLIDTEAQTIRLVVSEMDKRLRVSEDRDQMEQGGAA